MNIQNPLNNCSYTRLKLESQTGIFIGILFHKTFTTTLIGELKPEVFGRRLPSGRKNCRQILLLTGFFFLIDLETSRPYLPLPPQFNCLLTSTQAAEFIEYLNRQLIF
jgi:hypothetical protein